MSQEFFREKKGASIQIGAIAAEKVEKDPLGNVYCIIATGATDYPEVIGTHSA